MVAFAGVAAAIAAGTVPDVIKGWLGEDRLLLTGLCVIAASMFATVNLWQQRTKGVGIVVTLPTSDGMRPWSTQWTRAAVDHARREHDSCFAVQPERSPLTDRRGLLLFTHELVSARLAELSEADPATPVSLYINAKLSDAFDLGAMFKFDVRRELRGVGAGPEAARAADPVLPQRSERLHEDFFPAIRVSGRLKEPLSKAEAERAAALATVVEDPAEFEAAPDGRAVAIVVHLSDNPVMVGQALRAASRGCGDSSGDWQRCRAALVVDGRQSNLPESAADFELVVRHVYSAWRAWSAARPRYAELTPRLFVAAPASVAFALGWLLGHVVRVVAAPYETEPG
ncbi:hypothetical protein Ssi02_13620 [Sinosporangium siamense]|uniref:Uncharacterized protein n=1 Tax=Sinosporangium siamense TaxID=1367973 RepID=A0A919RBZ6_9ACTN|nr:hypothetical protein Ssi02_13620 [Sinosporangium siamense]